MKFLEILLSFISTQGSSLFQSGSDAVSRKVTENARKVAILLAIAVIGITLFCSGFNMAYSAIVSGFERIDGFAWSTSLSGGLILVVVAILTLVYSLGEKRWVAAVNAHPEERPTHNDAPGAALQSAIALLIVEIAHELKERRNTHAERPEREAPQV